MNTMTHVTKTVLSFIGGFIIGFAVLWGWNTYIDRPLEGSVESQTSTPQDLETSTDNTATPDGDEAVDTVINEQINPVDTSTAITVPDQTAGDRVRVAEVTLKADGWVVVHEEINKHVGNALGVVYRDAGTHADVEVPLLRNTVSGNRYWVVLYRNQGDDRQFQLDTDTPIRDEGGSAIMRPFDAQ